MTDCKECNGTGNDGGGPSEDTMLERYVLSAMAIDDLRTENERLLADRAVIYDWIREPDNVENASLEWIIEWLNRRPTRECFPLSPQSGEPV